ncbi:Uncharacterized protein M6B38_215145 [Iris pallida]|uniref:IBH1-like N-terminal domain-containing protein n=1 Tax=Iris pallida TaxID=29817 RepID=A0AAX6E1H8_IRIPA|nr:Uncharacterized protein M6B38_215145 [Iris pallida]
MDTSKSSLLANPNPNEPTMAFHFTTALANINASSSHYLRCRRIRCAAYASMAVAAGPGRAWSRALLGRLLRDRGRAKTRIRINIRLPRRRRRRSTRASSASSRLEILRNLVPGGGDLDLCCLLEESASYIQCLTTQVTLMQSIVDSISM